MSSRIPRPCHSNVATIARSVLLQITDLKAYANWLYEASIKFGVSIHAWVFMTNHVHLLMTPSCWVGISRTMQYLGRLYVRYFNFTYRRTGYAV